MQTIYKYQLKIGETEVEMPEFSSILSLQVQADHPTLWAYVDTARPMTVRTFVMFATGEPWIEDFVRFVYIGTVQLEVGRGVFVGHIFERLIN